MKEKPGDLWEALKAVGVGVFMPWVAAALTVKPLWDWRHEKRANWPSEYVTNTTLPAGSGGRLTPVSGHPDMQRVCTSRIERQNGSLRQW